MEILPLVLIVDLTLAANVRADCKKLDAIVFTHEHADHTSGIDDTRPYFLDRERFQFIFMKES